MTQRITTAQLGVETAMHMSRMLECVGCVYRKEVRGDLFV